MGVQQTIDQGAEQTRAAVESQERGQGFHKSLF